MTTAGTSRDKGASIPTISVVIATYQRPELLHHCLQSILENSLLPEEIIIVDQSEDSRSRHVVERFGTTEPPIRYVHSSPPNKSIALNTVIPHCIGDFLALTDDDVTVDREWLNTFLSLYAHSPDIDVYYGRMLPQPGTSPDTYVNLIVEEKPHTVEPLRTPLYPHFTGANCFMRRSLCLKAGLFNPHFGPGAPLSNNDDGEMGYRLARFGARMRFEPTLKIFHAPWRSPLDNQALMKEYAFSIGAFAGYTLRQGDTCPSRHLLMRLLAKARRVLVGILLWQSHRVQDGIIHLKAFSSGFLQGWGYKT
ncbi:MAG: glycosyltransferase family 2 protein [Magnetococcales bacterium]|nr:glycosyltransferase family 2 protein [Magnetococcales bacterium]